MEEIQNEMRMNRSKKEAKRDMRAVEKMARHNQIEKYDNGLVGTDPHGLPHGGGDAGLARVVGRGRKAKAAVPALVVKECESSDTDEEVRGGARKAGEMLKEHLMKLHGKKYVKHFYGSGGIEVGHAAAVSEVPPGGLAPVAYGNVPQAPASFRRNAVGEGMSMDKKVKGAGMADAGMVGSGKPKRTNARAQKIGALMRSKKMTLAEASRYLKEHPDA